MSESTNDVMSGKAMKARFESSVSAPKLEHFEWQEPDGERDLAIFRDIVTEGCSILSIYPDEAGGGPPFDYIYTVGFYLNLQHPEMFRKGSSAPQQAGS